MGLLKAGIGALGGVLADQWREYFYCDALPEDLLCTKGVKRTGKRSSNTKGSDNLISNGSIIAVADGQCMLIVEQGKIVDVCAEPGEFVYDKSTEPSLLYGGLNKENIKKTFAAVGRRFTFGGDTGKDQRVYYINTKEIVGNKFGTVNPVPFAVIINKATGADIEIGLRCNGEYSYQITDPLIFYTRLCANVPDDYTRDRIDSQMKSELLTALQPAFARLSEMGVRYSSIPAHAMELTQLLDEQLSGTWGELRGIQVVSFGINSLSASPEDEDRIKNFQLGLATADPTVAAGQIAQARAQAMRDAANNAGGAFVGFAGLNMAGGAGGAAEASLFNMGAQQQAAQQQTAAAAGAADGWTCACGTSNTGNFCMNCGKPKPSAWTCACGTQNTGNFCVSCGKPKPVAWTCACGTQNTGNFCMNCGKPKP